MVIEEFADRAQRAEACFLNNHCTYCKSNEIGKPTLKDFNRSGALVSKSIMS